jgi:hypothetical protein
MARRVAATFGLMKEVEECLGRGILVDGQCLCDSDWRGPSCEHKSAFNSTGENSMDPLTC